MNLNYVFAKNIQHLIRTFIEKYFTVPGSTSTSPQAPDEGTGSGAGEPEVEECQDDSCGENAYCKVNMT